MELKLKKITLPEVIEFNYEELKREITERTSKYVSLVYTDEQIKEAKTDLANLRKFTKALADERIRVKKDILKPFEDFESKVKELSGIVDEAIGNIDGQVKKYEDQKKDEKHEEIIRIWQDKNIFDWLNISLVFNEKWLNTSYKIAAIENEIVSKMTEISADLATLVNLPEFSFEAIEIYKQSLDINKAIKEGQIHADMAKRKAEAEAQAVKPEAKPSEKTAETVNPAQEKQEVCFRCWLTTEDAVALRELFKSRNIEYKAI